MSILVCKGLTKTYGPDAGVQDVDLEVGEGEVIGLIGPNGGGKSTLLLLMAGLVEPERGSSTVDGTHATTLARSGAGKVGLITARPGVYPLLTGWENLTFFGQLFGIGEAEVKKRVGDLLDELGVTAHLDRRVATYSSGMKQKLSFARALLMDPRVLLLDEPTANLDPTSAHAVHQQIRRRADRGLAVVLATHDLWSADHICDRVVMLNGGVQEVVENDGDRKLPRHRLLDVYERGQ